MNNFGNSRFTVNIYDVFANFLPGFIFLGGAALPFIFGNSLSGFSALEGSLFIFAAFAIGVLTQAIGSYTKKYQFRAPLCNFPSKSNEKKFMRLVEEREMPFNQVMEKIDDNSNDLSVPEEKFLTRCENIFDFDGDEQIEDWGYLFKLCLTQLEVSPYNRTLRIQAQHLATRGLYVSLFFLCIYYLAIAIVQQPPIHNYLNQWGFIHNLPHQQIGVLPASVLVLMSGLSLVISYVFYLRSVHFEEDVVNYMISEVVASQSSST